MKRRNISWSDEVETLAIALARERGIPVSQLLAQLVEVEKTEARVVPKGDVGQFSPGFQKLVDQGAKKRK